MVRTRKNSFEIDKQTLKGWGRTAKQKVGDRKRRKESLWDKIYEFCGLIFLGIGLIFLGIIFVAIFS